MKKYISIKVKTLMGVLVLATLLFFSRSLFWQGLALYNDLAPDRYQVDLHALKTTSLAGESERLGQLFRENNYPIYMLVTIEDGYTISGMRISSADAAKIHETYLDYDERFDLTADHPDYVIRVALAQWFSGKVDLALHLMDGFDENTINDDVLLVRAGMHLGLHDFETTVDLLEEIKGDRYASTQEALYAFMAHFFKVAVPETVAAQGGLLPSDKDPSYAFLFDEIHRMNAEIENPSLFPGEERAVSKNRTVTGRVTLDGKPIRGAFVYEKMHRGMSGAASRASLLHATDEKGDYQLDPVHEDLLGVGLALPWQLIHDKQMKSDHYAYAEPMEEDRQDFPLYSGVRFSHFRIVDDILHYEIDDPLAGRGRNYLIQARHTDPKYDVNAKAYSDEITDSLKGQVALKTLRANSQMAFAIGSSKDELAIERFIEPLYLSESYAFSVRPIPKDSGRGYVTNGFFTDALSTLAYVEGQDTLSPGDQLLAEGKVEGAMAWYEANPSLHGLKVLVNLYTKGYQVVEDGDFSQVLAGQDEKKAIASTKELMTLTGQREPFLLPLAHLYGQIEDFSAEGRIYQELIEKDPDKVYLRFSYAQSLINSGRFEEGLEVLIHQVGDQGPPYRNAPYMLLSNQRDHLEPGLEKYLEAISGLSSYSSFHSLIREGSYKEALTWLEKQPSSEMTTMYRLLFADAFPHLRPEESGDFIDHYRTTVLSLEDPHVRGLLKELKRYHNWF